MNVPRPLEHRWQLQVFPYFTAAGWVLILTGFLVSLLLVAPAAGTFFSQAGPSELQAPVAGPLAGPQSLLNTIPLWLTPLIFLGVASFIVGIAVEFSVIPAMLRRRGEILGTCFPEIVRMSGSAGGSSDG